MSAQKKTKTKAEKPEQVEDSTFGETLIAEEKDLETVIIQSQKTGTGSTEPPPDSREATVFAPPGEAPEANKAAPPEDNFKTVIMRPGDSEPQPGPPETQFPEERESPKESNVKSKPVDGPPTKPQPAFRSNDQKTPPAKKGTGMKNFLLAIFLLLVLGAGAVVTLRMVNPDSELLKLLPFKLGTDNQQQAVQTPPAVPQESIPAVSQKYDRIETGMTGNAVLQILGEPLRKKAVDRFSHWEYDTGTGLYQIKFQNDLVVSRNTAGYSESIGPQASTPATIPPPVATYTPPATQGSVASGTKSYDQVQIGMSPESVRQIMGSPLETRTIGQLSEWEYDIKTGLFQVAFQGGKVAFKGTIPYHTAKTDQAPSSTTVPGSVSPGVIGGQASSSSAPAPRDFTKITIGMTPDAVRELLGDPTLVKKLRTSIEWEYKTPKGMFEVRFRNNKVVFKGMTP